MAPVCLCTLDQSQLCWQIWALDADLKVLPNKNWPLLVNNRNITRYCWWWGKRYTWPQHLDFLNVEGISDGTEWPLRSCTLKSDQHTVCGCRVWSRLVTRYRGRTLHRTPLDLVTSGVCLHEICGSILGIHVTSRLVGMVGGAKLAFEDIVNVLLIFCLYPHKGNIVVIILNQLPGPGRCSYRLVRTRGASKRQNVIPIISSSFICHTSESGVVPLMTPFCEPRFFFSDIVTTGPDSSIEGWDPSNELNVDGNLFWLGPGLQISLFSVVHLLGDRCTFTTKENEM